MAYCVPHHLHNLQIDCKVLILNKGKFPQNFANYVNDTPQSTWHTTLKPKSTMSENTLFNPFLGVTLVVFSAYL
jgi:hypothetical protein